METRRTFLRRGGLGALAFALPAPALSAFDHGTTWAGREPAGLPELGVCRSPRDAVAVKAGGGSFLEVSCQEVLVPDRPEEEFARRLARLRAAELPVVAANGFLPGRLQATGPEADHDAILAYCRGLLPRASRAGIGTITFGSSAARSIPEGWETRDAELQFAALLGRLGPLAEEHGVTLCVEALRAEETNFLNRLSEARRVVAAVQHAHIGLTADLYHMLCADEPADSIRTAGDLVRHVHVAEERGRSAPGRHGEDFRPYLKALREIDYAGRISLECRWEDLEAQLPVARKTLKEQWADEA